MSTYSDKWFKEQARKDEEVCPEKWAEGEVDIMPMTIGQFGEYERRGTDQNREYLLYTYGE